MLGDGISLVGDNADYILRGFWLTIQISVLGAIGAVVIGLLLAAMRVGPVPVLRRAAVGYVGIFRNTPLIMVFFVVVVVLPRLDLNVADLPLPHVVIRDWTVIPADTTIDGFLLKASLAMALYTAAFVAEAMRSGINAVPLGQAEAARSIGMTFGQNMRNVVLPQAGRAVVPPMTSVLIAHVKNTSVAAVFGLAEATNRMRGLLNDNGSERTVIFLAFALGYVVLVELISVAGKVAERRLAVSR